MFRSRAGRAAPPALLALVTVTAAAGCAGGAIGASTPVSSGQSFVSGSYGTVFFRPGSRSAAPAVAAKTLGGWRLSLAAYRGSVVVLNFWGSWCAPCRKEAPALGALAQHFRSAEVRFVGVDIRDTPASAEAFMRTYRIGYPSLNDPADEIALAFHGTVPPSGIPTTLVIDRRGHIAARVVGGVSYAGLAALIRQVRAETTG